MTGKIVIISGPSGSGKTTLYRKLLLSPRLKGKLVKIVSVTTRLKRPGEIAGRDYIFETKENFFHQKRAGFFLESKKVFENYYGTPKKSVEKILRKGQNVLLCIDVQGARTVSKKYPQAIKIFIDVPTIEILKKRLEKRASESRVSLDIRLQTSRKERQEARRYHYVIINDDLAKAYKKLESKVAQALKTREHKSDAC